MEKQNKADRAIYLISLLMIALGVLVRLVAFLYNRSLFLDEAYLASSVVQRDYAGLFQHLDFSQGAPVGFLLLGKTCVYLFGASEYALRLIPLLSGLGAIALSYLVLKNALGDPRPYIGTAFFATIPLLIYYSIEFKPYMLDGFLALLSVYMFSLALKRKIQTWLLSLYCALVIWFSLPAIFTVAALCSVAFIYSIWQQRTTVKPILVASIVSLASFGLLFATVYQNVLTNQSIGEQFFQRFRFPLFPTRMEDLRLIYRIGTEYLGAFGTIPALVLVGLSILALTQLGNRKRLWFGIFLAIEVAALLVASWLGRYPIVARYVIFIIPLHILFASGCISGWWNKWRAVAIGASLLFIMVNLGSMKYFLPDYVFRARWEINPVLSKLEALDQSIPLYVYAHAIPQYEFKTGYRAGFKNTPSTPIERNSVIYGSYFFTYKWATPYSFESEIDPVQLEQDVHAIEAHNQVYLLFVTYDPIHRDALLETLRKGGSVSEILNIYETPLYLYRQH